MKKAEELYQTYVVDHQLERTGLFELLSERYGPSATVLYPGCFLHVTPSFFFQHIVYVDKNELAADFFSEVDGVLRLISARQQYRERPYVRFIGQDYTQPLPVVDASFDLLLALFAGGISRSCKRYLKPGGTLLTNDHMGDAAEAAADPELELIAIVTERRGHYELSDQGLEEYFVPKKPGRRGARDRPAAGRTEYARSADCYLFRKVRGRPSSEG